MSKSADKTDEFLLNCGHLFWGPLFIRTQCIYVKWNVWISLYIPHFLTVLWWLVPHYMVIGVAKSMNGATRILQVAR